ncbi:MAG TPA: TetR/AcrR family transcriptional regulator [Telmatospirillum sp.]|nr:TetR/AcrR family transcriptional regulator [Telmatospirillum sp.]
MSRARIPSAKTSVGGPPGRRYHHGNLRQALLEATVRLIEIQGLDQVSVRAVAKMVGVSPGAPFRHFPTRTALLTAVAEQAMDRLRDEIDKALAAAADENALMRYRALGIGFFTWAFGNPVHFQVISTRAVIDFEGSSLRARNDEIRAVMAGMMRDAQAAGLLRRGDPVRHAVAGRALAYGLARMSIDGQFPSWDVEDLNPLQEVIGIFDQFIASIAA